MINRENYLDVLKYIDFLRAVNQCDEKTISAYWTRLRHLLEWADGARFCGAEKIRPTYPIYLAGLKDDTGAPKLGSAYFAACCKTTRAFFSWAREENPRGYRDIDPIWIRTLRPPRARSEQAEVKTREIYTIEEVIRMATLPVEKVKLRRMQAAVAFLFLSGMRISAFLSLPISCVDLEHLQVYQLPSKGVMTKNHKAQVTTLLNIPELMEVVRNWDSYLRARVAEHILWYAPLNYHLEPSGENPTLKGIRNRPSNFRDDLGILCELAGVQYKSPHKFRHGHAVYGLKRAQNMAQMKAISQNLMHSSVGITDGIYGRLVEDDVHETIAALSAGNPLTPGNEALVQKLIELLQSTLQQKGTDIR